MTRQPLAGLDFPVPYGADGAVLWPAPDPESPFFLTGPALLSFSGGRTSALMLFLTLWAHGGILPPDVFVVFANTGKEREETLRFVHECETRWRVRIHWIEWVDREGRDTPAAERFREVTFETASRRGEPMKALIRRKKYLPNAVTRFCTSELKIDAMKQFMIARGFANWANVVGLRRDEVRRVAKQTKRNDSGKERWHSIMPLFKGGVNVADVWRFWLGENSDPKRLTHPLPQGFDLGLYPYEGNCDGCFLKGREVLTHQERERPGYLADWVDMEDLAAALTSNPNGARFRTEHSYADLQEVAAMQSPLIPLNWRDLEFDAECGVSGTDHRIRCGARAA